MNSEGEQKIFTSLKCEPWQKSEMQRFHRTQPGRENRKTTSPDPRTLTVVRIRAREAVWGDARIVARLCGIDHCAKS